MPQPTVGSIMHASTVTTTPGETLAAAQALMEREGVRQLPVLQNGSLVGMLSDRDLHAHTGYLDRTKVVVAMTEHVITAASTDTAAQAARTMLEHKINALPIVADGKLVGIVSRSDLLRLLIRLVDEGPNG